MDDERDESRDVADESEAEPGDYSQHDADQGYAEDDAGAYTGEYTGEYAGEDAALDGDVIAPADEAEPAGEGFAGRHRRRGGCSSPILPSCATSYCLRARAG